MFRTIIIAALLITTGCSDYEINGISSEEPAAASEEAGGTGTEVDSACQQDRSAYIDAEVVSLGEDAWIPGWNTVAEFTLTTDKDTCFDETFSFTFTTTDNDNTDWNNCEEYVDQDRISVWRGYEGDDALTKLNASWTFLGATGENGAYVHSCDPGRFIVEARPAFTEYDDTTILVDDPPLTFVVMMEAEGSVNPEDLMKVGLLWDDSSQVGANSGNLHLREGELLPFIE